MDITLSGIVLAIIAGLGFGKGGRILSLVLASWVDDWNHVDPADDDFDWTFPQFFNGLYFIFFGAICLILACVQ